MSTMEIVLLIAGGIIFILSFFLPTKEEKKISGNSEKLAKEEIKQLVGQELEAVKNHVDEVVEEAVSYAMEKTERSLERLSNEKIMAVNEYSDTVLAEIHKNHEEAMFLYDMLNNKHENLQNTVSEVNRTVKEAEETVTNFQKLAPEPSETVQQKEEIIPAKQVQLVKKEQKKVQEKPGEKSVGKAAENMETLGGIRFTGESEADEQNSNERILELHKQGKSRIAIAKELGLGVGEVKLVIDLFKNQ